MKLTELYDRVTEKLGPAAEHSAGDLIAETIIATITTLAEDDYIDLEQIPTEDAT